MEPRPCKVPGNIKFANKGMALRNVERKFNETGIQWFAWKCYDHYHVKPKHKRDNIRSKSGQSN